MRLPEEHEWSSWRHVTAGNAGSESVCVGEGKPATGRNCTTRGAGAVSQVSHAAMVRRGMKVGFIENKIFGLF